MIAATSRDLEDEVKGGRFRDDLMYCIDVASIDLPPLRERGDDIRLLIEHYVHKYAGQLRKEEKVEVSPEVIEIASRFPWPYNIRQLQNVLKRAMAMSNRGELTAEDLPDEVVIGASAPPTGDRRGFFGLRIIRINYTDNARYGG